MPVINFSLFNKKQKEKRLSSKTKSVYRIIKKDITGICHITIEGKYFIICEDGISYKFTDDSYIIKKGKPFYSQQIINNKRTQIKELGKVRISDEKTYLPFAPGIICIGNIVYNETYKLTLFKLKNTYIDNSSQIAKDAWYFFRDNYNTIRENIENNKN